MKKITSTLIIACGLLLCFNANGQSPISNKVSSPLAAEQASSGSLWNNISAVKIIDGSPANTTVNTMNYSKRLMVKKFNFQIPPTANVTGIKVRIVKGGYNGHVKDNVVQLMYNDTAIGINKKKSGGYFTYPLNSNYGNSTDMWGTGITANAINSIGFGVIFKCQNTDSNTAHQVYVDYIGMTVYYSLGARHFEQTSIGKINVEELSVSPNPARDQINFKIACDEISKTGVKIYNLAGGMEIDGTNMKTNCNGLQSLNISQLELGVYFLRVESPGDKVSTCRFIKK